MKNKIDDLLKRTVESSPGVPGVSAVITNKNDNIYEGAAGKRALGSQEDMTTDTVHAIFSTTKAITGTVCLQLWEKGELDLDAPAKEYAPAIGDIQVVEGIDDGGNPKLRAPKSDITTRQLLLHTAGFGYDFFSETYNKIVDKRGLPSSVIHADKECLNTPLLFDPGTQWEYGTNMDWAGQVCEGITGKRLGELMKEGVFDRLGMSDTAFTMNDSMKSRYATMHARGEQGELIPMTDFMLPQDPEVHMGGHGLQSTALDYAKFIRMWLNDGAGVNGQVLKPETVKMAEQNGLGDMKIKALPAVIPSLTNPAEFFPGMSKSWALTFMINEEDAPTGRPAGSLAWAGLANLYYWIDRKNGIGGFWATQIFPFADPASVGGYLEMEKIVYQSL